LSSRAGRRDDTTRSTVMPARSAAAPCSAPQGTGQWSAGQPSIHKLYRHFKSLLPALHLQRRRLIFHYTTAKQPTASLGRIDLHAVYGHHDVILPYTCLRERLAVPNSLHPHTTFDLAKLDAQYPWIEELDHTKWVPLVLLDNTVADEAAH